jgi:hypothetical protein
VKFRTTLAPLLTLAVILALGLVASETRAQDQPILYQPETDSPLGARNPLAPPEAAQFDFLIGDWNAVVTYTVPGKEPLVFNARWHNTWIVNGYAVMQEWRGPYATGAEFRYFDPTLHKWTGYNLYSGSAWKETWAEWQEDKMAVYSKGEGPQGEFLNRETYYDIHADSISLRSDRSFDDGATWKPHTFSIEMTRIRE